MHAFLDRAISNNSLTIRAPCNAANKSLKTLIESRELQMKIKAEFQNYQQKYLIWSSYNITLYMCTSHGTE